MAGNVAGNRHSYFPEVTAALNARKLTGVPPRNPATRPNDDSLFVSPFHGAARSSVQGTVNGTNVTATSISVGRGAGCNKGAWQGKTTNETNEANEIN